MNKNQSNNQRKMNQCEVWKKKREEMDQMDQRDQEKVKKPEEEEQRKQEEKERRKKKMKKEWKLTLELINQRRNNKTERMKVICMTG